MTQPVDSFDCRVANTQVGGDHYSSRVIQPIEYITKNNLDYLQGNVVKYVTRHKEKGGAEDIKKAIHYCQFILSTQYSEDEPNEQSEMSDIEVARRLVESTKVKQKEGVCD